MRHQSFAIIAATLAAFLVIPSALAGNNGVSEIRIGVLDHEYGVFSNPKEDGIDINAEILLEDLGWIGPGWELRPHLGAGLNTADDTSQIYAGLTAGTTLGRWGFFEFGVGGSVHDGELETPDPGKKELGCPALFHLATSLGVNIGEHSSLSGYVEHSSNSGICEANEALDNAGIRYGFRF
jgi:hypothetical protein